MSLSEIRKDMDEQHFSVVSSEFMHFLFGSFQILQSSSLKKEKISYVSRVEYLSRMENELVNS